MKTIHTYQKQYLSIAVPDFPYHIFVRVRVLSDGFGTYTIKKEMRSYNIRKNMSTRWNAFGTERRIVLFDKRRAKQVASKLVNKIYKDSLAAYKVEQTK